MHKDGSSWVSNGIDLTALQTIVSSEVTCTHPHCSNSDIRPSLCRQCMTQPTFTLKLGESTRSHAVFPSGLGRVSVEALCPALDNEKTRAQNLSFLTALLMPTSDTFHKDLRVIIERRQVVLVIGSGVSMATTRRSPTWRKLIESGIEQCRLLGATPDWCDIATQQVQSEQPDMLLSAAELVQNRLSKNGGGEFARWLREAFEELQVEDDSVINSLHALNLPIVTTNYDDLIEKATSLKQATWRDHCTVSRFIRGDGQHVLHLHGFWEEPESVVLGIRSYESVKNSPHTQAVMQALGVTKSLLFVGCGQEGLADPNFGAFLSWLGEIEENAGAEHRHYWLVRNGDPASQTGRVFPLSYGESYSDLAPFLQTLIPSDRNIAALKSDVKPIDNADSELQRVIRLAAEESCERITNGLELAVLSLDHTSYVEEFLSGRNWLLNMAKYASTRSRKRLCLYLAHTAINDEFLRRIPDWHPDLALEFFQRASEEDCVTDNATDALALSIAYSLGKAKLADLQTNEHDITLANYLYGLLDEERLDDAVEFLRDRRLNGRLAAAATFVFAESCELEEISRLMSILAAEAPEKTAVEYRRHNRCCVLISERLLNRWVAESTTNKFLTAITAKNRKVLDFVKNLISGPVERILSGERLKCGIDLIACDLALRVALIEGDRDRAARVAMLLHDSNPISQLIGVAVRNRLVEASDEICTRLKLDWQHVISAQIESLSIRVFECGTDEQAIDGADEILAQKPPPETKEHLAPIVLQLATSMNQSVRDRAYSLLVQICGADHYYLRMAEAKWALDAENPKKAEILLKERPRLDDPDWLNLRALSLKQQGKEEEALEDLQAMCRLTNQADALWRATILARKLGHRDYVISTLRKLRSDAFELHRSTEYLAHELLGEGSDESLLEAAILFQDLAEESPTRPELLHNAANCYRQLGQFQECLAILGKVHKQHPNFLPAYHLHSTVLEVWSKPDSAFDLLNKAKNQFWNDKGFLFHYMELGYKTDNELEAHRAMARIVELEKHLPTADRLLHSVDTEYLVKMIEGQNRFNDELNRWLLQGRVPWAMHALENGRSIYAGWSYRTQPVSPHVNVAGRAQLHTYATNGFHAFETEFGKDLAKLDKPTIGPQAVADITALITLYEIGLLPAALACFEKIILPSIYREIEHEDKLNLQPHQRSQTEVARKLDRLLSDGKLVTAEEMKLRNCRTVSCYYETDGEWYVGDLCNWLVRSEIAVPSLVEGVEVAEFKTDAIPVANEEDRKLTFLITRDALLKLDRLKILDELLLKLRGRVFISSSVAQEIRDIQFAYHHQSELLGRCEGFWNAVHSSERICFESYQREQIVNDGEGEIALIGIRAATASYELSREKNLPLLADDRLLICLRINSETNPEVGIAFSTLELIESLFGRGLIDMEERIRCKLKLVDWRYRNILFGEDELIELAKHISTSDGIPRRLQAVAQYVLDCILDIGQLGGNEPVEPARSIAGELYVYWTRTIARFVNRLWVGDSFTNKDAESLTRWAVICLLPTNGKSIRPDLQVNFASTQSRLFLCHLLAQRAGVPDRTRSAALMKILRDCLCLSESEFWLTIFEMVKVEPDAAPEDFDEDDWNAASLAMRRSIARHALSQFESDGRFQADARGVALLEASHKLRKRVEAATPEENLLEAMKNIDHPLFMKNQFPGPLFFHFEAKDETRAGVFAATDLLMYPNANARRAAVDYFGLVASQTKNVMSARTAKLLTASRRKISQKSSVNWYPNAELLLQEIDNDWQMNLAGFRQCLRKMDILGEHLNEYWYRCVTPLRHPAASTPASAFAVVTDIDQFESTLGRIRTSNVSVEQKAEMYLGEFSHLPLSGKRSLASISPRDENGRQSLIDVLQKLSESEDYLRAYHGCMGLIALWDYLDENVRIRACQAISAFLLLSMQDGEEPLLHDYRHRFLQCLRILTVHFMNWIPLFGPEIGEDNSASLAWSLAHRLTFEVLEDVECFEDNQASFLYRIKQTVMPSLVFSREANRYVKNSTYSNPFAVLSTLDRLGGPFLAALIVSLREHLTEILASLEPEATQKAIRWIVVNAMYGLVGTRDSASIVFDSFKEETTALTECWLAEVQRLNKPGDDAVVRESLNKIRESTRFAEAEYIHASIDSLRVLGREETSNWIDHLRLAHWNRQLDSETLFRKLSSTDFLEKLADSFDPHQIVQLMDVLMSIQVMFRDKREQPVDSSKDGERWIFELPYVFLAWLDRIPVGDERKLSVADACICSSVIGGVPRSVQQLVERSDAEEFAHAVEFHRNRVRSFQNKIPKWAWAQIRWLLGALPG